jgi:ABC-type lipoprotein release transport system permease subunit
MTPADDGRPPRLARWLLRRALDGAARSAIVGDLDEEYARFVVPREGARKARRWYWRQALMSIAACARGAVERRRDPDRPSLTNARALMQDSHGLGTDFRAAARFCVRSPLTSAAVILTLAIGVAANTAVFAVLNATFLKKLPIAHPERLVAIGATPGGSFSYPEYLASRGVDGLAYVVAGGRTTALLGEQQSRRRVVVDLVTANYFDAIGVGAGGRGRVFTSEDDHTGQPAVAVLNHEFWQRHFGGDPAVVGRTVPVNRSLFTIVGIAPRGFSGPRIGFGPDLWIPLTRGPLIADNPGMLGPRSAWLGLFGILEPTGRVEVARAALTARWRALGTRDEAVVELIPRGYTTNTATSTRTRLRLVSVFVGLILVIGCLNVTTLLGAGVHERQKELAIRASLGAGRLRLLRQLLIERVLLAAAAGVVGGSVGVWMAYRLASLMASPLTTGDLDVSADGNVVLFTTLVAIAIALAVGAMPALRWSKVDVVSTLQGGSTGLLRLLRSAGVWWLIPGQVALGTVLLASAGVLVKTVHQLRLEIDRSSPERVWFADLETDTILSPVALADVEQRLRAHLRAMPGTEEAALSTGRPLSTSSRGPVRVEGLAVAPQPTPRIPDGLDAPPPPPPPPKRGTARPANFWIVSNTYVSPGYFTAMALPILKGRDFTNADTPNARRVAIINETFAKRAFGAGNPIGRRVSWAEEDQFDIDIVGVVADFRSEHLRQPAPDSIFFPIAQTPRSRLTSPTATGAMEPIDLTVVLRAARGQRLQRDQLAQHMAAFDSRAFVDRVWTFEEEAGRALSQERLLAWAGSTFGAFALGLLVIGLYGTLAAAVVRGRRELGIRLALGATPGSVGAMVVARSVIVVVVGLVVGLPLSYVFIKSFAHVLYGVQPVEPLVLVAIVAIVLTTAIAAAYFPARRAAKVDPVVALRGD